MNKKPDTTALRKHLRDRWDNKRREYPQGIQVAIGRCNPNFVGIPTHYCPVTDATAFWGFHNEDDLEEFIRRHFADDLVVFGVAP